MWYWALENRLASLAPDIIKQVIDIESKEQAYLTCNRRHSFQMIDKPCAGRDYADSFVFLGMEAGSVAQAGEFIVGVDG